MPVLNAWKNASGGELDRALAGVRTQHLPDGGRVGDR